MTTATALFISKKNELIVFFELANHKRNFVKAIIKNGVINVYEINRPMIEIELKKFNVTLKTFPANLYIGEVNNNGDIVHEHKVNLLPE